MKRIEEVYRHILYEAFEKDNYLHKQSEIAEALDMSLSVGNLALKPLKRMLAVRIQKMGFSVVDLKKILYYWASIRNLEKDIIYSTRIEKPVRQIESEVPSGCIFGAYSAYKFRYKDVPADYSEVYIYADDMKEIAKRFPKNTKLPNLIVLEKDKNMEAMTVGQIFVDLWNLKEWYAKYFLEAIEARWNTGTAP